MRFELRDESDGSLTFTGYAALTGEWYPVRDSRGSYEERIDPDAFSTTLRSAPDVILSVNHGQLPLARTTSGTLALSEDERGLRARANLDPSDPDVASVVPKVRRGDLTEMSLAFKVLGGDRGQSWDADFTRRTLHAIDLDGGDVSLVTRGANRNTTADIRAVLTAADGEQRAREVGFEVRGTTTGLFTVDAPGRYSAAELKAMMKARSLKPGSRSARSQAEQEARQMVGYQSPRQRRLARHSGAGARPGDRAFSPKRKRGPVWR